MKRNELPIDNKELASDLELARKAQARRLAAPVIHMGGKALPLRRKQLIETFAPDCVNKHVRQGRKIVTQLAPFHPCFIESKDYRKWLTQGYEPVVTDGAIVEDEGDVLVKCPQELYKQSLLEPAERAAFRARDKSEDAQTVPGAMEETMKSESLAEAKASVRDET